MVCKHFYMVVVPKAIGSVRIFDRQNILLMTNTGSIKILNKQKMCWHELSLTNNQQFFEKQKEREGSVFAKYHDIYQVNNSDVYVLARGRLSGHVLLDCPQQSEGPLCLKINLETRQVSQMDSVPIKYRHLDKNFTNLLMRQSKELPRILAEL